MHLNKISFLLFSLSFLKIIPKSYEQEDTQKFFVDPKVILVEKWDGWGTSLAWWADVLGGMEDEVKDAVTDAFFSPNKLNLNIVRYVIGGTIPKDVHPYPCGEYRDGAATETYKDSSAKAYNWTRDARQREILIRAKKLGVNTFEAFSNSPPQWLTISGCSKGNPDGGLLHSNFAMDDDKINAFTDYATEVIKHFHEEWGVTFETYDPFNEPLGLSGISSWNGKGSSQEGCSMDRPVMVAIIKSLYKAFQDNNMTYVSITAADETQINTAIHTLEYFKAQGISEMISKVNVHGYWDLPNNRRDLLSSLTTQEGQKLWMDEMGWEQTSLENMTQGLFIAKRIVNDVRNMLPSAWVYWQVMEDIGAWGVITIPYKLPSHSVNDIQYNSGYYSFMQFTKYIKQGYKIILINDENAIAAFDEVSHTLIIVAINDGDEISRRKYDLQLFTTSRVIISTTRTSASEQNFLLNPEDFIDENKFLTVDTAPSSITTIIISNIRISSEVSADLLKNGDFEYDSTDSSVDSWTVEHGSAEENGLSTSSPWRGGQSGFLEKKDFFSDIIEDKSLTRTITLPGESDVHYRLFFSAWCVSSGRNTRLTAWVRGSKVKEIWLSEKKGYGFYGLSFEANAGDEIKVQLVTTDGPSFIDEASLHYVNVPHSHGDSSGCNLYMSFLFFYFVPLCVSYFAII